MYMYVVRGFIICFVCHDNNCLFGDVEDHECLCMNVFKVQICTENHKILYALESNIEITKTENVYSGETMGGLRV